MAVATTTVTAAGTRRNSDEWEQAQTKHKKIQKKNGKRKTTAETEHIQHVCI